MKQLIKLTILLLLISCTDKEENKLVEGQVSNYEKDFILFGYDTIGYGLGYTQDTIRVDQKGYFQIEIDTLKATSQLNFLDEHKTSIILPKELNSRIEINANFNNSDSLKIIGKQADFVHYIADQYEYWIKLHKEMSKKHPIFSSTQNHLPKYHTIQDSITSLRENFLLEYFKNKDLQNKKEFIKNQENSLLYQSLSLRMEGQNSNVVQKMSFYDTENDTTYITHSDLVKFDDKNLFANSEYREFTRDFILNSITFEYPEKNQPYKFYLDKGFKIIDKWFRNQETNALQKVLFTDYLIENAIIFKKPIDLKYFNDQINSLEKNDYVKSYAQSLKSQIEKYQIELSYLKKGSKSPDFKLEDLNGKIYKLSDFKSKTLLIDVWASWCGPCISAFPKWNKLVQENRSNKNLEFLTVSIDDTKEKWIKGLKKYNVKGLDLFGGTGGFDSKFAEDFNIKALPNYIAIDNKGKIISISTTLDELKKLISEIN